MTARIDVVTIFPAYVASIEDFGIVRLGVEKGLVDINTIDLRDFTTDRHRQVDDEPYGGGAGMVMKPEPFWSALEALVGDPLLLRKGTRTVLTTPQGRKLDQPLLADLARTRHLVILCGRYEGVDERVRAMVSDEISLGDFVLSGGEIAAMAIVDGVTRLIEGVVGSEESVREESFVLPGLEYPQFTRPKEFMGIPVPEVLREGNHRKIAEWRARQSELRTMLRRSDLQGD